MPRTRSPQRQLEFAETGVMRWEELPAALRDRAREQLAQLLRQAARRASAAAEVGDDE